MLEIQVLLLEEKSKEREQRARGRVRVLAGGDSLSLGCRKDNLRGRDFGYWEVRAEDIFEKENQRERGEENREQGFEIKDQRAWF